MSERIDLFVAHQWRNNSAGLPVGWLWYRFQNLKRHTDISGVLDTIPVKDASCIPRGAICNGISWGWRPSAKYDQVGHILYFPWVWFLSSIPHMLFRFHPRPVEYTTKISHPNILSGNATFVVGYHCPHCLRFVVSSLGKTVKLGLQLSWIPAEIDHLY